MGRRQDSREIGKKARKEELKQTCRETRRKGDKKKGTQAISNYHRTNGLMKADMVQEGQG